MPENISYFARHAEEYSAILEKMAGSGNRERYEKLNDTLRGLNDQISRLTAGSNPPRLTKADLDALRSSFAETIKATEDYIGAVGEDSSSGYVAQEIARLLHKDAQVINRIPDNNDMKLSDALYHARTLYVEVAGQKLGNVGGSLSSRIPLSYYDSYNQLRQGFFTPNYRIDDPTGLTRLFQARYPQYKEYLDILNADDKLMDHYAAMYSKVKSHNLKFTKDQGNLLRQVYDEAVYNKCFEDKQFRSVVRQYMSQRIALYGRDRNYTASDLLNADSGTSVTDRNCAMSTVASLMGMDGLLAKSQRVVLVQNGHELEGCFMDTARGSDPARIQKEGADQDTLMWQWLQQTGEQKMKPQMTGNALRQMADLSVLDYVCGNVDRHLNNFTYQFIKDEHGVVKLDGVMGIDNDNSFGKDSMVNSGKCHNLGLPGLTAIPQSTAERILSISPEQLDYTLADYGLSLQEKEAAKERLVLLRGKIMQAKVIDEDLISEKFRADDYGMCIIPDEDFNRLTPEQLAHRGMTTSLKGVASDGNIFANLSTKGVAAMYKDTAAGNFVYDPNNPEQQLGYAMGDRVEPLRPSSWHSGLPILPDLPTICIGTHGGIPASSSRCGMPSTPLPRPPSWIGTPVWSIWMPCRRKPTPTSV